MRTWQKAVGAYVNMSLTNTVFNAFATTGELDRKLSIIDDMRDLIKSGLTVVMYYGDGDYIANWLGGQAVAHEIGVPGFESAGFVNVSTPDGVVHGQVKQAGKFSFMRIYQSGHEVGSKRPYRLSKADKEARFHSTNQSSH
jgi:carboxypeptidase C (cathepsin A)